MTYYVRDSAGAEYGPANLDQLNAWIEEGRIGPDSVLRPESSPALLAARTVAGLRFSAEAIRVDQAKDRGGHNLRMAWICVAFAVVGGLIPCSRGVPLTAPLFGVWFGWRAYREGAARATLAIVVNVVAFALVLAETLLLPRLIAAFFPVR